ncbi:MAG: Uma2 family endonuclease [Bacteroidia bacterium]|nr:Uma2 family endonuclease [Bacteroidia bacterium]
MTDDRYIMQPQPQLGLKKSSRSVSLLQYVQREANSDEKYEFHNGKIVKMPFARGPHNAITANIIGCLKVATRGLDKKYPVFSGDQKIYLPEINYGVYPDVVVVDGAPVYWDDDTLLLINPLLVVEVLSRSTQRHDRTSKFDLYKTRVSFQEYVLVRQDSYEVETRYREAPDLWRETVVTRLDAEIPLRSLGCTLKMAEIYEFVEI